MKLTILILFMGLQVSAIASAQQITLNVKNVSLEKVLRSIQKQSKYGFVMNGDDLKYANPVTLTLKSASIETTLQSLFATQPFIYRITGKLIMIQRREAERTSESQQEGQKQTNVSGQVADKEGRPLAGATVLLIGNSNKGTSTNDKGEFILFNVPASGHLLVRMVGYASKELPYEGGRSIRIVLSQVNADLSEIQIIAYGEVQKKFNTSNVGTIKAQDIQNQPVGNLQLALAGRVPGMFIRQGSGISSSNVDIQIQGRNSLFNGSQPFYVIDGIPYSPNFTAYSLMGGAITGSGGSAFNFINPADIESVTILKDADATAIYGSRAANGAILITTRKGQAGKTQVDVDFKQGWGKITRRLNMMNTQEYLEMRKDAYINAGQTVPSTIAQANGSNFDLTVWDQNRYTDWQQELVGGTAQFTNLQASVSGGSDNTQFLAGYGYLRESTVYMNSPADNKANVHFSLNHNSADKKFRYSIKANYLEDKNKLYNIDLMNSATILAPNAPALYNPDGTINFQPYGPSNSSSFFFNPATNIETQYRGKTTNLIADNKISYELIKGLQAKVSAGFNRLTSDENKFYPSILFRPDNPFAIRAAYYLNKSTESWIVEPQLTYRNETSMGVFDILLGGTVQRIETNALQQRGLGYPNDNQLENRQAATSLTTDIVAKSLYRYNALFGRLNYRLFDKYIINFTARRDGSSRFGEGNKLHNFYSVGGAWLWGSEHIVKDNIHWISSGKLRANYGSTGNDQISDYRYLSLFNTSYTGIPYLQSTGIQPNNIANPFIQWEETRKLNLGLDIGLFDDKLQFIANYFRNRSSNQLIRYDLPSTAGFTSIDRNFPAVVQNEGLELELYITAVSINNFTWRTSANISFPKNKLVSFPGIEKTTYAEQLIVGYPINVGRFYKYAGVNSGTGLYEFETDKGERTSTPNSLTDRIVIMSNNPKYYGGLSNTFNYKSFSLDFLFQFVKQNGQRYRFGNGVGVFNANQPAYFANRWRKPGDISEVQKVSLGTDVTAPYYAALGSDASFADASFIRLKNASLTYAIPNNWLSSAHISQARLFVQGQNLFTVTKFVGTDPETQSIGALPPLRMIAVGIHITL